MSSMLEQAIVDANALKEAAIKNAETMVIEKYSDQIKEAVDSLLEQPEEEDPFAGEGELEPDPMADLGLPGEEEPPPEADPTLDQIPPATAEDLPDVEKPASDADIITLDLPDLQQTIQDIEEEEGLPPAPEETHQDVASSQEMGSAVEASPEASSPMFEDLDIDEVLIDELLERLKVDIEPAKTGWLGAGEAALEEAEAQALAREADDEVKEENEALRKRVSELEESIKIHEASKEKLAEENSKFMEAVLILKEKVEGVNVSNAKLLYINKALENPSLNERQRRKIVEAISAAETTKEAKVIYETLQSTVGSTEKKKLPKSLSEAVNRNPSLIVSSHRNVRQDEESDSFSTRMKRLAGIK